MLADSRKLLNIFLGSPGDLTEERQRAQKVIHRFNNVYGRAHGIVAELLCWEDMTPGKGRPQSRINEHLLKQAHLFIGLLWKHWGTPTGDKKYSSGFEEEYFLAKELNNIQEMWILFKDIPEEELKSPTASIQKVDQFRQSLIQEKNLTYKTFPDADKWEEILFDDLLKYCGKLIQEDSVRAPLPASPSPQELPGFLQKNQKKGGKKLDVVKTIVSSLKTKKGSLSFDLPTRMRLFSIASALLYNADLQTEILDNHEINLLYKHHRNSELTSAEKYLVLRSIISDEYTRKPGWKWQTAFTKNPRDILNFVSEAAGFETLRARAVHLLGQISGKRNLKDFEKFLGGTEEKVITTSLEIFGRHGTSDHLPHIDKIIKDRPGGIAKSAWSAKLEILAREDPRKALQLITSTKEEERSNFLPVLKSLLTPMSKESLSNAKSLIFDSQTEVRFYALESIIEYLETEEVEALLTDESHPIRGVSIKELIRRGRTFTTKEIESLFEKQPENSRFRTSWNPKSYEDSYSLEECLQAYMQKLTLDELKKEVTWFGNPSRIAYQLLVERHFDSEKDTIKNDLQTNFIRIKKTYFSESEISSMSEEDKKKIDDLDSFVASKFLKHVVRGLKELHKGDALYLARIAFDKPHGFFRSEILSNLLDVFVEFGNEEDAERLLEALEGFNQNIHIKVVQGILELGKDKKKAAEALLAKEDNSITKAVFHAAFKKKKILDLNRAKEFLAHEDETVRMSALAHIVVTWNRSSLEPILNELLSEDRYYYDVVCFLDRILYAPIPLRPYFRNELLALLA